MPLDTAPPANRRPKPLVLPLFIPNAGCPHRCVFCNQVAITGQTEKSPSGAQVRAQIDRLLSHPTRQRHPVEIAFFGGNFLGQDPGIIRELLSEAARYVTSGQADGIRFSTRPDTLNQAQMDLLKHFPVTTIEIGAQSMSDKVLTESKRGHLAADTARAMRLLKASGYRAGLQLMVGLPFETRENLVASGLAVVALKPDFVRIYPTLVLSGSLLAQWYQQKRYAPLEMDEALWRTKTLYRLFHRSEIGIIRMGLQASADLAQGSTVLAGPYHPAFGQMVFSALFLDAAIALITKAGLERQRLELRVHPKNESKLRGLHNHNLHFLKARFEPSRMELVCDAGLTESDLWVNGQRINVYAMEHGKADNWVSPEIIHFQRAV